MEENKISLWVKLGVGAFVLFVVWNYFSTNTGDIAENIGGFLIVGLVPLGISFWCASKCSEWALEIKKSINVAYLIGFFLSLVGLLGYWLYSKDKRN